MTIPNQKIAKNLNGKESNTGKQMMAPFITQKHMKKWASMTQMNTVLHYTNIYILLESIYIFLPVSPLIPISELETIKKTDEPCLFIFLRAPALN